MYLVEYVNKFLIDNNIASDIVKSIQTRMNSVVENTGVLKGKEFKSKHLSSILEDKNLIAGFKEKYIDLGDDYLWC